MTLKIKPIHSSAISAAHEKAEKYRLLNDPSASESICLDILSIDPENQKVLVTLLLSRTDQFRQSSHSGIENAREVIPRLKDEYQKHYYNGVICERWAIAALNKHLAGSGSIAFDWLMQAISWYEKAEKIHPSGNDESILRYNSCVRVITRNALTSGNEDRHEPYFD